jgi:hypothetical protein
VGTLPWMPNTREARRRGPLVGYIVAAIAGVLMGILLTVGLLIALAPQPRIAAPAQTTPAHATVTLDNAFLTALAAAALQQVQAPFAISNVRVAVHPGNQLVITADATSGLLTRQLTMAGTLESDNGRLHLAVTQTQIGGLPLPGPLNLLLESALNARLATLDNLLQFGGAHYAVTTVTSQEGKLTLGLGRT